MLCCVDQIEEVNLERTVNFISSYAFFKKNAYNSFILNNNPDVPQWINCQTNWYFHTMEHLPETKWNELLIRLTI